VSLHRRTLPSLFVVALTLTVFGLEIGRGTQAVTAETSPASVSAWRSASDQQVCWFRSIRSALPRGAAVIVETANAYDQQRLTELATPWARPVTTSGRAAWVLTLRPGGRCGTTPTATRRG